MDFLLESDGEERFLQIAGDIIQYHNQGFPYSNIKPMASEINAAKILIKAKNAGKLCRVKGAGYKITQLARTPVGTHCEAFEKAFPNTDWDTMQRASEKEDYQLTSKLEKMVEFKMPSLEEQELTPERLMDLIYLQCLISGETDGRGKPLKHNPVPPDLLHTVKLNDTSPGFQDPSFPGSKKAPSKREQFCETLVQFTTFESAKKPPLHVDKPSPKKEVTQGPGANGDLKSKDLRYIMAACTYEIFTANACGLDSMVSVPINPSKGTWIEITKGFYEYVVYKLTHHLNPDMSFDERCETVKRVGLTKIDYSGWEIHVGLLPKLVYAIVSTGRLSDRGRTYYSNYVGLMASYLCPVIGIKKEYAAIIPDCVSSGKKQTLDGNGDNHKLVAMDTALNCEMPDSDKIKVFAAIYQGDDFGTLKLDMEKLFVARLGIRWGMIAVPEGEGTPDLLQRYLDHLRKTAFMDTMRAIKKIYHNDDSEKAAQQAASLRFQCNAEAGSFEHDLWEKVTEILPMPERVGVENLAHDDVIQISGSVIKDQHLINLHHRHKDVGNILMGLACGLLTNTSIEVLRERNDIEKSRQKSLALFKERGLV